MGCLHTSLVLLAVKYEGWNFDMYVYIYMCVHIYIRTHIHIYIYNNTESASCCWLHGCCKGRHWLPSFSCHYGENKWPVILPIDNEVLHYNDVAVFYCSSINVHKNVSVLFFEQFLNDPMNTIIKIISQNFISTCYRTLLNRVAYLNI